MARFNGSDAVKATVLARKAGLDISLARAFLVHLRNHFRSEAEVAMVAHLAEALGDTQMAVRIGKTGDRARPQPLLLRLSDPLAARLHAAAHAGRARRDLRHRPPGERVQLGRPSRTPARAASCRSCR